MRLESAIDPLISDGAYPLPEGDWEPMLREMQCDAPGLAAARFHNALVNWIVEVVLKTGVRQVAMSGGVFQNRYLVEQAARRLERLGLAVYTHQRVPANDGGIALGQAVLAAL